MPFYLYVYPLNISSARFEKITILSPSLCLESTEWVLWEHAAGPKDPNLWKENMKQLCSFNTVEGFWQYFNHIPKPSEVFFDGESRKKVGPDGKQIGEYSLFKRGIEPEWGDPKNRTGGEWFYRQTMDSEQLNMCWQNLVLGVVGETIEDTSTSESYVNGARVVDKGKGYPVYRLELWVSTKDSEAKEKLHRKLVEIVTDGLPPHKKDKIKFEWKDH